ncbi:hypothetical protein FNF28_06466 [Cafeteria roenbergensis]|uniref:Uncharacterized protein n=1 Tax=Cafeteria roenbergensis TaxID=33653 RepID=A0A5A8D0I5_CAFRO|nr:hypothetical protein FNF28_06466 [Cafeteria roenbergensis]
MDGADNALAPLFRQAQEEYDRVVGENRELREANHRLQQSVRSLSDELRMSKARFESDSQAAAEAREALRAQNASLLKKHQAVAEQAARLQLQLAQLTRLDNERILRGSGNDGAETLGDAGVVFVTATTFPPALMAALARACERLKPGAVVVSTGQRVVSPLLEDVGECRRAMPWGASTVYFSRRARGGRWLAGVLRR